jgi:dipeptidyl aminopeptidase/acylaminoacyl peptidase
MLGNHQSLLSLVFVGVVATGTAAAQPAAFTAEDMLALRGFSAGQPIALTPDGKWVAYVVTDVGDEWNVLEPRPRGHLHVQRLDPSGGSPRALTAGALHGAFPVWSPDGRRLAFYREDATGGQLVLWDRDTDRLTPLGETFSGRSYLAPQWEPSGQRILYAAAAKPSEPGEPPRVTVVRSTDARIPGDDFFLDKRAANLVVMDVSSGVSSRLFPEPTLVRSFRLSPSGSRVLYAVPSPETFGVIGKERNETFVMALAGGPSRKVLEGKEAGPFSWSPDGRKLVFRKEGKLLSVPVEGGDPSPLFPGLNLALGEPVWSPDGKQFLALVPDETIQDPEIEPASGGMYTVARPFMDLYLVSASDGAAQNLTGSFEDQVSDPLWSGDGKSAFFRTTDNRTYNESLQRYDLAQAKLTVLTSGEESYDDLSPGGGVLVFSRQDATHPPDLWLADIASGTRRRLTELNPQLARFRFSKPELFDFYNADGEKLAALLYKPVDFRAGMKVPVITWVYEKLTPGIHRFNARHQVFLNHGYAVLMPNVKVKVGETATAFVKSVVPAVNTVRQMGITNGRFALWGHSFGAYATSYVITQTDIFACAVSGATPPELFRNWASGRDRDSRNIETGQARMGGSPFEFPERYLSQSAFFQLHKVKTPVLILHGVKDLTILYGEGEMMFYALRRLGKEASFVGYTHGDHSLSRHSRADTLDVNRRILEWFERYLKPEREAVTAEQK